MHKLHTAFNIKLALLSAITVWSLTSYSFLVPFNCPLNMLIVI